MLSNFARNARLLWYFFATPKVTVVPVFTGGPGGGKSALFEQVARALKKYYVDFAPAQMMPEDFGGMPTHSPTEGFTYEMMRRLKLANEAPNGAIINLDELSNVPRATQAGMLRFVHTRWCGDHQLKPSVLMGGAMNPTSSATDAQEIAPALANRAGWLPWLDTTGAEHSAYMLESVLGGVDMDLQLPEEPPAEVYAEALRDMVGIYAGFMDKRGQFESPDTDDRILARSPLAYFTPRSGEAFIRVAAMCRVFGDIEAMTTIAQGIIGPAMALEFMALYEKGDLPSPEAWLKDAKLFSHDPKRPDRTFAATAMLALAAVDKNRCAKLKPAEVLDRWNAAWDGLIHARDTGAPKTTVAIAGQTLAMNRPAGGLLKRVEAFIEEIRDVIKAAGYTGSPTTK